MHKPDFSDADGIKAAELEGEFAEMDGWNAEVMPVIAINGHPRGPTSNVNGERFAGERKNQSFTGSSPVW